MFPSVLLLIFMVLSVSCVEDEEIDIRKTMEVVVTAGSEDDGSEEEDDDTLPEGNLCYTIFANNSYSNQSADVFKHYLFIVPKFRGRVYMYSLKEKKLLCSCAMTAMKEINDFGSDIYHCNQTSFGADYYDSSDPFPLLYVSQRYRNDLRCFTEVFRILPHKSESDTDYTSFEMQLVQVIYFPPMSESNSLGNVNTVIDKENHLMYTYSRNNVSTDNNYRKCKITCFPIPDVHQSVVYLEDADIKNSFMLGNSALYMQGGCINEGKLYIGQGKTYLYIVDLETKQLQERINLVDRGFKWELEGCFFYKKHVMISTGKYILKMIYPVDS